MFKSIKQQSSEQVTLFISLPILSNSLTKPVLSFLLFIIVIRITSYLY